MVDFVLLTHHKVKIKECEKLHKYLNLGRELKTVECDCDSDTNCSWFIWNGLQRLHGVTKNQRKNRDNPNNSIV